MVNFKVVDGDYFDKYDEFIRLYNNPLIHADEIRKRLQIGFGVYNRVRRECAEKGLLVLDKHSPHRHYRKITTSRLREGKNYYYVNGSFSVRFRGEHYCTVGSEDLAERVVARLKECGWDKSMVNQILEEEKNRLMDGVDLE